MRSDLVSYTLVSPGTALRKILETNHCSIIRFAHLSGFRLRALREILAGGLCSHAAIRKISTATQTAPRYWYYMQNEWLSNKYLSKRKSCKIIEPFSISIPQKETRSPGSVLEHKFIRPTGKTFDSLENAMGFSRFTLQSLVSGKQGITILAAYRLGKTFNTGTKYWLDLQSVYEIGQLVKDEGADSRIIHSLARYSDRLYTGARKKANMVAADISHPGKFLLHRFIAPSSIHAKDWSHLLCVSTRSFNKILTGKSEMSPKLIIKICKVFKTDIVLWLEMQNQFYSAKADRDYKKLKHPPQQIQPVPISDCHSHPFQVLTEAFLKPMGIPVRHFMKHIGLSERIFDHRSRGRKRIDFELAVRLGQTLGTGANYWIGLQLEFDIHNYERGGGAHPIHLH